MDGRSYWCSEYQTQIVSGLIETDETISFDINCVEGWRYTVSLKIGVGGVCLGSVTYINPPSYKFDVQARLYTSSGGQRILSGAWTEDNEKYKWIVELN